MYKKEDYLKVYQLTLHYRKRGSKGAVTENLKNLSKINVDSILGDYKSRNDVDLFKYHVCIK